MLRLNKNQTGERIVNQYKLIALDLDGTALAPGNVIAPETREAVVFARSRGCRVVVSTGRICGEAAEFAADMGADDLMVAAGGATIARVSTGKCTERVSIDWETAVRAAAAVERLGLNAMIYVGERLLLTPYCDMNFSRTKSNEGYLTSKEVVPSVAEYIAQHKVAVDKIFCRSTTSAMLDYVRGCLLTTENLRGPSSGSDNVEIMAPTVNKARALEKVAAAYGTDLAHTIAIGDSPNDIEMLEAVGMPVAMGNATDEVKAIAKKITLSNAEHGVARAIYDLLTG